MFVFNTYSFTLKFTNNIKFELLNKHYGFVKDTLYFTVQRGLKLPRNVLNILKAAVFGKCMPHILTASVLAICKFYVNFYWKRYAIKIFLL